MPSLHSGAIMFSRIMPHKNHKKGSNVDFSAKRAHRLSREREKERFPGVDESLLFPNDGQIIPSALPDGSQTPPAQNLTRGGLNRSRGGKERE